MAMEDGGSGFGGNGYVDPNDFHPQPPSNNIQQPPGNNIQQSSSNNVQRPPINVQRPPGNYAAPMNQETGQKILDMLLESKEENRQLHASINKLQEDSRRKDFTPKRPEHLHDTKVVTWKNVGCEEQYSVWDGQWTKIATADVKLDHIAEMLQDPEPDLNRITDLIAEASSDVKEGRETGEQRMHELLLVNDYGWDFLREFKKPKTALDETMAKDIKSTLKVVKEQMDVKKEGKKKFSRFGSMRKYVSPSPYPQPRFGSNDYGQKYANYRCHGCSQYGHLRKDCPRYRAGFGSGGMTPGFNAGGYSGQVAPPNFTRPT